MYSSERVVIDTRKYDIDEMLFRYKQGKIILPEKKAVVWKRSERTVKEVMRALLRGIPFPPVYASELQTGELLILDKSDKLRFLLEYLTHGESINDRYMSEDMYLLRDIMYSTIMVYVIDYMNPKYIHMQVGKFVEEWTPSQEQSIWNMLYQRYNTSCLEHMVTKVRYFGTTKLILEYYLMHFAMVDFIQNGWLKEYEYREAEKFRLLEDTLHEMNYRNKYVLDDLCNEFERIFDWLNVYNRYFLKGKNTEEKMKHLCFMHIYDRYYGNLENYRRFASKMFQRKVENCDMSYKGILDVINFIKREK